MDNEKVERCKFQPFVDGRDLSSLCLRCARPFSDPCHAVAADDRIGKDRRLWNNHRAATKHPNPRGSCRRVRIGTKADRAERPAVGDEAAVNAEQTPRELPVEIETQASVELLPCFHCGAVPAPTSNHWSWVKHYAGCYRALTDGAKIEHIHEKHFVAWNTRASTRTPKPEGVVAAKQFACTECPYIFTEAEIAAEDKSAWGHPCHGAKDEEIGACESFREPVPVSVDASVREAKLEAALRQARRALSNQKILSAVSVIDYALNGKFEYLQPAEFTTPADKWMPIESAPKDGTEILLYWQGHMLAFDVGYWSTDIGFEAWRDSGGVKFYTDPTHWMPLPAAPEANNEAK